MLQVVLQVVVDIKRQRSSDDDKAGRGAASSGQGASSQGSAGGTGQSASQVIAHYTYWLDLLNL